MAIFLVQHGLSLSKEQDPSKGLSGKGRAETVRIAEVAKGYNIPVKKIVHSGKKRAEQTAIVFKDILGITVPCEPIDSIRPLDDVKLFGKKIDSTSNLMVVGHLPFMERLVSYLIAGSEGISVIKFQNSGIVCLDGEAGNWFIKWTLNPDIS